MLIYHCRIVIEIEIILLINNNDSILVLVDLILNPFLMCEFVSSTGEERQSLENIRKMKLVGLGQR